MFVCLFLTHVCVVMFKHVLVQIENKKCLNLSEIDIEYLSILTSKSHRKFRRLSIFVRGVNVWKLNLVKISWVIGGNLVVLDVKI